MALSLENHQLRALDAVGKNFCEGEMGLIVAEAVMMGLAPKLGRQRAHDLVYDACRHSLEKKVPFLDVLKAEREIMAHVTVAELTALVEPGNYVGLAGEMVDQVLGERGRRKP